MTGNTTMLHGAHARCLNGWWDFLPLYDAADGATPDSVPASGWLPEAFLAPSTWTIPVDGTRRPGERYYTSTRRPGDEEWDEELDCLFDIYGYPKEWSTTRRGWIRRFVDIDPPANGRRVFVHFAAVCPRGRLFWNGSEISSHVHPCLPWLVDVTDHLAPGRNEIAVLVEDYERDEHGRAKVPTGNWIPESVCGIWQDVFLLERPSVRVDDATVRTSVRDMTISCVVVLRNDSARDVEIDVAAQVKRWKQTDVLFELPSRRVRVAAGRSATVETVADWPQAPLWSPADPQLCMLHVSLQSVASGDGEPVLDEYRERFGFREVWIEGRDIILNGRPIRMFSDWGHKPTLAHHHEGWIRRWFAMIRDGNMNHSRLHTHPHPVLIMDIADEEGILITGETGMHGAGGAQGADDPAYWEAAADHVRRFVARDKNHPCIVLWSVENEMRWNRNRTDLYKTGLRDIGRLFGEIDPTRPAYHEGDTSLWDERELEIMSRHYGKECSGLGWWDRLRPLHSGEMSLYHYSGPNNTCHLGGDSVWASFAALDTAAAADTRAIVEDGRVSGVCCFGPWNISCLENLRTNDDDVALAYDDWTAPGAKPLRLRAWSAEFSFWTKDGPGYRPQPSFAIQRAAFRPFAAIDTSRRTEYYAGTEIERIVHCVNDTGGAVLARVQIGFGESGSGRWSHEETVSLEPGGTARLRVRVPGAVVSPGEPQYTVRVVSEEGEIDSWTRTFRVDEPATVGPAAAAMASPAPVILVYGPGRLKEVWVDLGVEAVYLSSLDELDPGRSKVLVIEPFTVEAGTEQNRRIREFCLTGGRVIVLEQRASLFPGIELREMPIQKAFVRVFSPHPALLHLTEERLQFWGDSAYSDLDNDAFVARKCYAKPGSGSALALLEGGEGGFGTGSLAHSPLLEIPVGAGTVWACQLTLADRLEEIPAARRMLVNLVEAACGFDEAGRSAAAAAGGDRTPANRLADRSSVDQFVEAARAGATVLVEPATPDELEAWNRHLPVELAPVSSGEIYQAVRVRPDPLLDGISNEDTSGIVSWTYGPSPEGNVAIGSWFLAPADGLVPLLETPTQSCLAELFVHGGKTEPLRAHTLTRFLGPEAPQRLVALGTVAVGSGRIVFSLIRPTDSVALNRYRSRLLVNLGLESPADPLQGDAVPHQGGGTGYPRKAAILRAVPDDARLSRLVSATAFSNERMVTMPILDLAPWETEESAEGAWQACAETVCICFVLSSHVARKNLEMDIGVPNPQALTFLDLAGSGTVEPVINARRLDPVALVDGSGTLSDVALERGNNHVLLIWRPESRDDRLSLRWRDIMRRPETDFRFHP